MVGSWKHLSIMESHVWLHWSFHWNNFETSSRILSEMNHVLDSFAKHGSNWTDTLTQNLQHFTLNVMMNQWPRTRTFSPFRFHFPWTICQSNFPHSLQWCIVLILSHTPVNFLNINLPRRLNAAGQNGHQGCSCGDYIVYLKKNSYKVFKSHLTLTKKK